MKKVKHEGRKTDAEKKVMKGDVLLVKDQKDGEDLGLRDDFYKKALEEGRKDEPDLEKTFNLLNESLKSGNPEAAYALGTWYLHGKFVKKNIKKAVSLLRQAAKHNIKDALYDLAVCYEDGVGVKKNFRLAMECFLRAALRGDKQSIYNVGRCYYHGIGVNKDRRLAWIWLDYAKALGIQK